MQKCNLHLYFTFVIALSITSFSCGPKNSRQQHIDQHKPNLVDKGFSKAIVINKGSKIGLLDYGILDLGVDTSFVFEVKCDSKIPFVIQKLEADCVCTTSATITPMTVKKNEVGRIIIGYKTKIYIDVPQELQISEHFYSNLETLSHYYM